MTSKTEQFYIRRIADLEKQVAELVKINETLVKKNPSNFNLSAAVSSAMT
ncbi:MAG: hypothetical protein JXB29_08020 [Sedimentisphaerales bacterium]|nr:hypothetical protein [Sedimentisphaerales bacterium]